MKDPRLKQMREAIETALKLGDALCCEHVPGVMEQMRLELVGRLLVDARRHLVSMQEVA